MNENLYIAYKKLPHETLRVHSSRYTQCIHVSSRKLKTTKGHALIPKSANSSYPPTPCQKWNYTQQLNVKIYTELQIMITQKKSHTHCSIFISSLLNCSHTAWSQRRSVVIQINRINQQKGVNLRSKYVTQVQIHRGCTSDGVYVPRIYTHAR